MTPEELAKLQAAAKKGDKGAAAKLSKIQAILASEGTEEEVVGEADEADPDADAEPDAEPTTRAHRRLALEELVLWELALRLRRASERGEVARPFEIGSAVRSACRAFPYLTSNGTWMQLPAAAILIPRLPKAFSQGACPWWVVPPPPHHLLPRNPCRRLH